MTDFATRSELDLALADVLNAPKTGAAVEILCRRPGRNQREFPRNLRLTQAGGITGDYEMRTPWLKLSDGSPDPRIQVSILPARVLNLLWRDRVNTIHPGDTFVADLDVTLANMPVGTRLKIGDATIEVSDLWNDGCVKWKVRFGREAYDWTSDPRHESLRLRGIYCRVVEDGDVQLGDMITKI